MKCLLCPADVAPGNPLLGPFRARSESSAHDDDDDVDVGSRDAQLWSTFVLTQMFDLSNEECRKLLETGGVAGDKWVTKICGTCVHDAQQFRKLEEERLEIERKMGSMRQGAQEKLVLGLSLEDNRNNGMESEEESLSSIQRQIRIYFQGVFRTWGSLSGMSGSGSTSRANEVGGQTNDIGHIMGSTVGVVGLAGAGRGANDTPRSTLEEGTEEATGSEERRAQRNVLLPREPTRDHNTKAEAAEKTLLFREEAETTTLSISNVRSLNSTVARNAGTPEDSAAEDISDDDNQSSEDNVSSQGSSNYSPAKKQKQGHPCTTCGKLFRYKSYLTRHLAVHTGVKSFVCQICRRGFLQMSHLNRHVVVMHTHKSEFACNVCNKRFPYKCELTKHSVVHTVELGLTNATFVAKDLSGPLI